MTKLLRFILFAVLALGPLPFASESSAQGISHLFVSPKADGADTTVVQPSDWNEDHVIDDGAIGASKLDFDPATQAELDAHTTDTVGAHPASAISFTPNGSIAATDVQAAIQEVRDEAGAGTGDIEAVWGCTTGDCSALTGAAGDSLNAASADSSIPGTQSTSLPGTCTEGQVHQDTDSGGSEYHLCTATDTWTKFASLQELTDHISDATDAHNITAITNGVGATATFANDNSILRADGTGRNAQATGTNATIDDSGNITANSIKTGGGTSSLDGTAGAIELGQGTAPSGLGTTSIQIVAPTGVTSYRVVLPTAAATGFLKLTNSANTLTGTIEAAGGGGSGVIYIPAGSASVDGTFCTISRQQQNSGPFKDVMRCADNASGRFDITINTKGMGYAGANITLTAHWYHATSETITWASDISMQCRGTGDVINNTYSTPANLDISVTTVDNTEKQETTLAAHTPDGTCADGDEINIKGIIDATTMSANAANTQIIGWTIDLGL